MNSGDGDAVDPMEADGDRDDENSKEACEACAGWEDVAIQRATEYKAKGWDPERQEYSHIGTDGYGMSGPCDYCGQWFDFTDADAAYAAAPGPETPTVSTKDRTVELARQLGIDDVETMPRLWTDR